MCGISTDITSRKRAEQELKESKDRIGQIIDHALDAFVSMDSDGHRDGVEPVRRGDLRLAAHRRRSARGCPS